MIRSQKFLLGILSLAYFSVSMASAQTKRNIVMSMYTVHNNILKMTVLLDSVKVDGKRNTKVTLSIGSEGNWTPVSSQNFLVPGYTAHFRKENWNHAIDQAYQVSFESEQWTGVIRKDPIEKKQIIVAALGCMSPYKADGGERPVDDIVRNVKAQKADFLVFNGDQVYHHTNHNWNFTKFGYEFGELMRDIPTICMPDDHDVGQPNLWGSGGKDARDCSQDGGTKGGYCQTPDYVKVVERVQTWNMPDPYDPTPIARGIGVYYTRLKLGGIDFGIIEDRKWKSGPQEILKTKPSQDRWDHITNPNIDVLTLDAPNAQLLGDRQHKFIRDWGTKWDGVEMKCILAQSVFANIATVHGPEKARLIGDLDANGWPQSGRNKALHEIRRSFAFTIGGDQHLTTVSHMGIDDWRDAGYAFVVPALANIYPRAWLPLKRGMNCPTCTDTIFGDNYDGFKNKVTVYAAGNPGVISKGSADVLVDNSTGYGIVIFDKEKRTIKMESWPRNVNVTDVNAKPYPGWPITITQEDNYGRKAVRNLPTITVKGMTDPIIQIIDESAPTDSVVYTIRINGDTFTPKVFKDGKYTIRIGEFGVAEKTLTGVSAIPVDKTETLQIEVATPIKSPIKNGLKGQLEIKRIAQGNLVQLTLPKSSPYQISLVDSKGAVTQSRIIQGPGKFLMSLPTRSLGIYHVFVQESGNTQKIKLKFGKDI